MPNSEPGADLSPAPMTDFNVCGPLPEGITLLEASAGTGKTWTVAALVTRYVAEAGMPIREVLVVTFSRAATAELRERVHHTLEKTLDALMTMAPEPYDVVIQHLQRAAEADRVRYISRLRAALADFDTATIATIHQFCGEVLASLGTAGDVDAHAHLVENVDELRDEVLADVFLQWQADPHREPPPFGIARTDAQAVLSDLNTEIFSSPNRADRIAFAHAVRTEYARRKRRGGILEFDDLLAGLADALKTPNSVAAQRMRHRWKAVIVDEFQDTDAVQWQVFRRAFGESHALILIGDPKQAIYGFRGGDIHTYQRAADQAHARHTLPTNYRSDKALVDSLTTLLGSLQLSPGIVAHPIQAVHETSKLQEKGAPAPLEVHYADCDPLDVKSARGLAARDAAARIAQLLTGGTTYANEPLEPHHIAVLAHTNAQLQLMREELHAWHIPTSLSTAHSVLDTEAASWWLELLHALDQPRRTGLVRAALLNPLLGWSPKQLDELGSDEATTVIRGLLTAYAGGGIAGVLDGLRAGGLTARILRHPTGERHLTDVEHVGQLLTRAEMDGAKALPSLIAWLNDARRDDESFSAETRVMRLESDAHAITLSTIHASKGLQYPIVFAPFLWNRHVIEPKEPGITQVNGQRVLTFDKSMLRGPERTAEALAEELRLLYVAMTRAESKLVTAWIPTKKSTMPSALTHVLFGQAATPDALRRLMHTRRNGCLEKPVVLVKPAVPPSGPRGVLDCWAAGGALSAYEISAPVTPSPLTTSSSDTELAVRRFHVALIDRAWRRTSYSALASAAETDLHGDLRMAETDTDDDDALTVTSDDVTLRITPNLTAELQAFPSPMANLPMGATFGSLVHAVLEHSDFTSQTLIDDLKQTLNEQLVMWPVHLDHDVLVNALHGVLTTPLGEYAADIRLCDIDQSDRLPEMEFELPLGGGDNPHGSAHLEAMADSLEAHLQLGDPLLPYAQRLRDPALGDQLLRGYLTGSIDLTFRHDGRYYVVDYKTNWLGDNESPLTLADYTPVKLQEAMNHSSYPLQALLYAIVLHRYLRWRLPEYDPERHLGGVMYLYVRGMAGAETPVVDGSPCGVFAWAPPASLVVALSDVLDGSTMPDPDDPIRGQAIDGTYLHESPIETPDLHKPQAAMRVGSTPKEKR